MRAQEGHATENRFYTITTPTGDKHDPPPGRCWTYTRERFAELVTDGRIYGPSQGRGKPRLKRYEDEAEGLVPFTIWPASECGDNSSAKKELLTLFPGIPAFSTSKPEHLLERIVHVATKPGEVVFTASPAQERPPPWLTRWGAAGWLLSGRGDCRDLSGTSVEEGRDGRRSRWDKRSTPVERRWRLPTVGSRSLDVRS